MVQGNHDILTIFQANIPLSIEKTFSLLLFNL